MKHNLYNVSDRKYHYFYKITNIITGQYYYGIHSTNNLNDGYMGSGQALKRAMEEYGKQNFIKEILKLFNTRDEASVYENKIVTQEVIDDVNCYNLRTGGDYGICIDTVLCFDTRDDTMLRCKRNDPLYLDGTYVGFMTNRVAVFDIMDNMRKIVSCDEYYKNKDRYQTSFKNKVCAKDKNGNIFLTDKDDKRFLSEEIVHFWKGKHHSLQTKQKIKETQLKYGYQKGEKNSQYRKCWITKNCINKSIKKDDLQTYLNDGWIKGKCEKWSNIDVLYMDYNILKYDKEHMTWKEMEEKYKCNKQTLKKYISQCV